MSEIVRTATVTATTRRPFGERLAAAMDKYGPLCVGIDPHPGLLRAWGLPDDATGVREFGLRVVDALGGHVAALKPQSALFERHGSRGVAAMEEVLAAANVTGTLTIVDAKRGDIGSTMEGYADAYLRDGSPLAGDALTVSPYLGFGSLRPAIDAALATGRGLFVLCLTSNPEGKQVQHARLDSESSEAGPDRGSGDEPTALMSVAAQIAAEAAALNVGADPLGSIGLVVGATIGDAARRTGTDLLAVNGPLLAPGVGAQGAGSEELAAVFGRARPQVLASSSRAVLVAGPEGGALLASARESSEAAALALRG